MLTALSERWVRNVPLSKGCVNWAIIAILLSLFNILAPHRQVITNVSCFGVQQGSGGCLVSLHLLLKH